MWFKNLTLFRFTEPFALDAEELAASLGQAVFRHCASQEMITHGWVPPLGRRASDLVHAANGCLLVCLQTEEKVLPATVVKEIVTDKVAEIEDREMRTVRRRERDNIRDEVFQDLLPRAFTRTRQSYAYIDPRNGWLVIDAAARKAVEEVTQWLRKSLGSLPILPPRVVSAPATIMTAWLMGEGAPSDFELEDECELRDGGEDGGVVRCKGQDLGSDEIRAHLQAGKQVTRLALAWNEHISLVLTEDLGIRRLRFLDLIREQLMDVEAETEEQLFDAEFAIMTGELAIFLPRLLAVFGGVAD